MKRQFASDNQAGICPEAMEAIARANVGHAPSYGDDAFTARAAKFVRELFETDCDVYFVFNGTAANALALSSLGRGYQGVICHERAHIHTSECGAVPFYSGGMELRTAPGREGKLRVDEVKSILAGQVNSHHSRACALSVTQASEMGTVYDLAELTELCRVAKSAGLKVHMDGARFANAVAGLGCSPAEMTWKLGVDVLCFGGTKNGMMLSEATVFFDRSLAKDFPNRMLQAGQLASKMRFSAAQWIGMIETGAWLKHARHANAMAKRLEGGLRNVEGISVMYPVQANAVYADMPLEMQTTLRSRGWEFFTFLGDRGVRLMCAWDTTEQDVDQLVADVSGSPGRGERM